METNFEEICISNIPISSLGYVVVGANLLEKHDRSAPSDHHWKILKCRMMIFLHPSILAYPDQKEVKQIHIIYNKCGDDFDTLVSLFERFALQQEGIIKEVTDSIYKKCFEYTMLAKISPTWNIIGYNYLINNRNFLTTKGTQDGLKYQIDCNEGEIKLKLKAIKLMIIRPNHEIFPGECVRVFPSLNSAVIVEDSFDVLPKHSKFKSYKDLKKHWKNIHGYRLPDEEGPYYSIRFWRGDAMTYPRVCCTQQMPIEVKVHKKDGDIIIKKFIDHLMEKMSHRLTSRIRVKPDIHGNPYEFKTTFRWLFAQSADSGSATAGPAKWMQLLLALSVWNLTLGGVLLYVK